MKSIFEETFKKSLTFWDSLPTDEKDFLISNTVAVSYKKGEIIHDGAECTGVIMVKTGCLRLYILSENGKDITLYRLYPGDICMLSASCVIQSITFDVTVEAEADSECFTISGAAFAKLAEKNPYVKIFALETAVGRFSDVMWVMQQILFMSFDRRLAIFLLDETSKTGDNFLHLTHEQIAKYMGSAREVVSRMLKYFSSEGIVEVSRGGIRIIDKNKLRERS